MSNSPLFIVLAIAGLPLALFLSRRLEASIGRTAAVSE